MTKAIILAGGKGTRLGAMGKTIPKCMLPIHGKPNLHRSVENLREEGISDIIISVGHLSEQIIDYFSDGSEFGVNITYCSEDVPLGTGGAIKKAIEENNITSACVVINGDNVATYKWRDILEQHHNTGATITIALVKVEDVSQFGVVKLDDMRIVDFVEKPAPQEAPSDLINAGAYVINPEVMQEINQQTFSIEKEIFEPKARTGQIYGYIHQQQWFATDTPKRYENANQFFMPKINPSKKAVIIADVDETICESCQEVSNEMASKIDELIKKGYEFAFISGTDTNELKRMISSKVEQKHHILATTGTKYTLMENKKEELVYNYSFNQQEKEEIMQAMNELIEKENIKSKTTKEDQLQDRISQITLSAIGRNAPKDEKAAFDPSGEKRKVWASKLKEKLGEKYDIKVGGTTSIDITKKGLDKEWGIRKFAQHHNIEHETILFFGDKIYPTGNDFPATKIVECIRVSNPQETLQKLSELLN